jgi:hypothetical protein
LWAITPSIAVTSRHSAQSATALTTLSHEESQTMTKTTLEVKKPEVEVHDLSDLSKLRGHLKVVGGSMSDWNNQSDDSNALVL